MVRRFMMIKTGRIMMSTRRAGFALAAVLVAGLGTFSTPAHAAPRRGPNVRSVTPASGATSGGARVTLHGSGFTHVRTVRFGRSAGRHVHVLSSRKLTVVVPRHAAGTINVRVTTSAGRSAVRHADRYTFVSPPRISSMSPTAGAAAGGTRLKITGARFASVRSVHFGSVAGTGVRVASTGVLYVTAPRHAAGRFDVRVTAAYGTSTAVTADRFTYLEAPKSVGALAGIAPTAESVTLRWSATTSPGLAGLLIRRSAGSTAPTTASAGTLVAHLGPNATTFTDTGLARNTTYSYAVFAYTSAGPLYSSPANVTVTTPANSTPGVPTDFQVTPAPIGDPCGAGPDAWLGALGPAYLTLGAHVSDPDGADQLIKAHFRLWDLGGTGSQTPTDLVGPDDPAGVSDQGLGSGADVTVRLDSGLLTDGHRYGTDAAADDGTVRSAESQPCQFWYDASAPAGLTVTSPQTSFKVGEPVEFDLAASEVAPADGRASGIDHFDYAFSSSNLLAGDGGTHLRAVVDGLEGTASFSVTPTTWGTNYLYVDAVDKAGNQSIVATFEFYAAG